MKHVLKAGLLALSLAAVGCGGDGGTAGPVDAGKKDGGKADTGAGCSKPLCNDVCCEDNEICNPLTMMCEVPCVPQCAGKQCGPDNCGNVCGTCGVGQACSAAGVCESCTESDAQFCARLGKSCGPATGTDKCGQPRAVPECGPCTGGQTCTATGVCQACVPNCAGKSCGDNGCGGSCGDCAGGTSCNAGQCVACTPNCGGRVCGVDAAGCSCGTCSNGQTCNASGQCESPCNDTDAAFCARNGRVCGPLSGTDLCGKPRTVASCGQCAGGQSCTAAGTCQAGCTESDAQFCARLNKQCGMATGTDICGQPRTVANCQPGCGAGQTCNNGVCQGGGVTCNGVTCAPGQGCFDPTTGATTGNVRCTCLPALQTSADTCEAVGMVCDFDFSAPAAASCRAPDEYEPCSPAVGCPTGLQCLSVPATEWPYDGKSRCMIPCTASSQCLSTSTFCKAGGCRINLCADPENPPAGSSATAERAKYFQACVTNDGSGGTCLPWRMANSAGSAYVDKGICFQNGTVPANGACNPEAQRPTLSQLCAGNTYCDAVQKSASGNWQGICRPTCDAKSATSTCSGGGVCEDYMWNSQLDQYDQMTKRAGVCYPGCSVFTTTDCAGVDGLGNQQVCIPEQLSGAGACQPTLPTAGSAGAYCSWPSGDYRMPCGKGLYCDENTSKCVGWCSTTTCSSATSVCASCVPSGYKCAPLQSGQVLGMCSP